MKRLTTKTELGYIPMATNVEIVQKLGELEDLIESGKIKPEECERNEGKVKE